MTSVREHAQPLMSFVYFAIKVADPQNLRSAGQLAQLAILSNWPNCAETNCWRATGQDGTTLCGDVGPPDGIYHAQLGCAWKNGSAGYQFDTPRSFVNHGNLVERGLHSFRMTLSGEGDGFSSQGVDLYANAGRSVDWFMMDGESDAFFEFSIVVGVSAEGFATAHIELVNYTNQLLLPPSPPSRPPAPPSPPAPPEPPPPSPPLPVPPPSCPPPKMPPSVPPPSMPLSLEEAIRLVVGYHADNIQPGFIANVNGSAEVISSHLEALRVAVVTVAREASLPQGAALTVLEVVATALDDVEVAAAAPAASGDASAAEAAAEAEATSETTAESVATAAAVVQEVVASVDALNVETAAFAVALVSDVADAAAGGCQQLVDGALFGAPQRHLPFPLGCHCWLCMRLAPWSSFFVLRMPPNVKLMPQ